MSDKFDIAVTVRQAKITDLDGIAEVEKECFPSLEAASKDAFEKRLELFPGSFLLAETGGKIVGIINGCVTDSKVIHDEMFADSSRHKPDGDYQAVFGLAVIPGYRGQGIAARLMNEFIELTRNRDKRGLILTCKEELIGFYSAFGYESLGVSDSGHGGAVWYDMIIEF